MWVKQCHKPPMTGNAKHTTYKNGDDWVMVLMCYCGSAGPKHAMTSWLVVSVKGDVGRGSFEW